MIPLKPSAPYKRKKEKIIIKWFLQIFWFISFWCFKRLSWIPPLGKKGKLLFNRSERKRSRSRESTGFLWGWLPTLSVFAGDFAGKLNQQPSSSHAKETCFWVYVFVCTCVFSFSYFLFFLPHLSRWWWKWIWIMLSATSSIYIAKRKKKKNKMRRWWYFSIIFLSFFRAFEIILRRILAGQNPGWYVKFSKFLMQLFGFAAMASSIPSSPSLFRSEPPLFPSIFLFSKFSFQFLRIN